jgi:hypothetical protein
VTNDGVSREGNDEKGKVRAKKAIGRGLSDERYEQISCDGTSSTEQNTEEEIPKLETLQT